MTDVTMDVSGPGAERAALYAKEASGAARDAEMSAAAAYTAGQAATAAALTGANIYPTIAAGLVGTANGGTFWAFNTAGKPSLYQRNGAVATQKATLAGSDGFRLSAYGAVADVRTVTQVTMAARSAVLTTATDSFSADDVGKGIRVAGAGAASAKLTTTIASFQSARQVTLAVPATTATTDASAAAIGTDCAPALQAALGAVRSAGGGTVVIDGYYLLGSPVLQNFDGTSSDVRLTSDGSDAGLLIAGGSSDDMISITGVPKLRIDGVNFAGTPGELDDMHRVLNLLQCEVRIRDCGFYGLSNMTVAGAAVIYVDTCDLGMADNVFGGCAMASGLYSCVVNNETWAGFSSYRDRFLDYGNFRGIYHSKTVINFCYAWIRGGNQFVQNSNAVGQSVFRIVDSRFDEGHYRAILIETSVDSGSRVSRVHLDGVQINNTFLAGGSAIRIVRADHVRIDRAAIGWANQPRDGITLDQCGEVVIDGVVVTTGAPGTDTGSPDGLVAEQVDSLTIINSPTIRRLSLAAVGRISRIENGAGGVVPFAKLGPIDDGDFAAPPPVGTVAIDTLNRRTYTRMIDGWLAGPVMTAGDARLVLRNVTPATGKIGSSNVYTKTAGGENWKNCVANLAATVTGGFRMLMTFPTEQEGVRMRAGAQLNSQGLDYVTGANDIQLGVLLEGGYQIYLIAQDSFLAGPFAYTPGQLVDLRYNAGAGTVTLLINGKQVNTQAAPASITPTTVHRFSSTLQQVGTNFELLGYAAA